MKPSELPGLRGLVSNALALNREIARAIGFLQVSRARSGGEPAGAAPLAALFEAAAVKALNGQAGAGVLVMDGAVIPMTGATGFDGVTISVVDGVITAEANAE